MAAPAAVVSAAAQQAQQFRPFAVDILVDSMLFASHKAKLESIAVIDNFLLVGTTDGHVCLLGTEKRAGKLEVKLTQRISLGVGKKPVEKLLVAVALRKIIALCDNTVVVLQLSGQLKPVPGIGNIKNVTAVCIGARRGQMCTLIVVKKKIMTVYELTDALVPEKEFTLKEPVVVVDCYGHKAVYANTQEYGVMDLDTGEEISMMMYNLETEPSVGKAKAATTVQPLIHHTHQDEFILAAAGSGRTSIGMFISTITCSASRSTLQWSSYPNTIGYRFPYIVGVMHSTIEVHSLEDQHLQQSIDIPGSEEPLALCEGHGRTLFVLTRQTILALTMQTLETQIENLVRIKRFSHADTLIDLYNAPENTKKTRTTEEICTRAAFQLMREGAFAESVAFLKRGKVDVRLVMALFPGISSAIFGSEILKKLQLQLQEQYNVSESVDQIVATIFPTLSGGSGSNSKGLTPTDTSLQSAPALMRLAYMSLGQYIQHVRSHGSHEKSIREEMDTALLKIFADTDDPQLYEFLTEPNDCLLEESENCLASLQKMFALALLNRNHGLHDKALSIWVRLLTNELTTDETVATVEELVEYMAEISDARLIWKHAAKVFELQPQTAVQMFLGKREPPLPQKDVFNFVRKYGDEPTQTFLENLIFKQHNTVEEFHTELAFVYLRKILGFLNSDDSNASMDLKTLDARFSARTNPHQSFLEFLTDQQDGLSRSRVVLIQFLQESNHYRPALLLDALQNMPLRIEFVVLYYKTSQHDKALELLIFQMKDFKGAEDYCRQPVDKKDEPSLEDRECSRGLFLTLLKVYMTSTCSEEYLEQTTHLLDSQMTEMDVAKVLNVLPSTWHLGHIEKFLVRAIRRTIHDKQEGRIVRNLYKGDTVQVQSDLLRLRSARVVITDTTICPVCRKRIDVSVFARHPNGQIVHLHCNTTASSSSSSS